MHQVQLRPGDEFVVWTRPPGDSAAPYRAARVLVGPPGAEPLQVAVGGESEYRPFPARPRRQGLAAVMSRHYRPPRPRRVPDRCQACGEKKPPAELFIYVDGNNGSITRNSPVLCEVCYKARYGEKS